MILNKKNSVRVSSTWFKYTYTNTSVAIGDFSIRDAVLKNYLHFLKFYMNFCFFLQISSNTASFSLFFKFIIRFFLIYIFWDLRSKRILLCVNEGRSQKLIPMTWTPHSLRWKSTNFHEDQPLLKENLKFLLILLL